MNEWVDLELLLLLLGLGLLSSIFSAMETAFFSLAPGDLRQLASAHPRLRGVARRVLEEPRRTLHLLLLADTLCNVPLVVAALFLLHQNELAAPLWLSSLILFALIVFGFALLPKLIARRQPQAVTRWTAPAFLLVAPVLQPVAEALDHLSERVASLLIPPSARLSRHLSEEELQTLVTLGQEDGAIEADEAEMIFEIMKLDDKSVKDVMTPRVDIFSLPDDWSNERAIVELKQKRYRHVPVFGETPDEVRGLLITQRLLAQSGTPYLKLLIPPIFVPDTMRAVVLLKEFLAAPKPAVIVVDEFGGTQGIVTLSDIIEEIISDAVPRGDRDLYIEEVGDGTLLVSGSARIEDLMELGLPDWQRPGIDTIGGWLFHQNDGLPKPGDRLEFDGVRITVRRTSRKRIKDALLEIPGRTAPEEEEAE